jgi:hypothetical protein|tara:strand:- start:311 stop:1066 length:756 start_codon:yes stop_codon:yes gene_type:complete
MSPTNNKTEKDNAPKSKPNIILTLFILCIAFVVPVGLWFSVVYSEGGGIANLFFIFAGVYGFTLLTTLMFYRMGIQGDKKDDITKINKNKLNSIAGTTFASCSIVLTTLFILAVNPSLITILEDSIGIWVLGIMGYRGFMNKIFKSELFSKLDEYSDSKIFDSSCLLTRFNKDNIDTFIKFFKESCNKQDQTSFGVDFPFDFTPVFENEGQLDKLKKLVDMKRLIGYFSWVYLTSIVSLIISVIAVTMKTS